MPQSIEALEIEDVAIAADATTAGASSTDEPLEPLRALNATEMRAWLAFLRAHVLVTRELEADLLAGGGPSLAEYDVLVQLALTKDHALRMHELADRVVLSRAGITRLVDRLVAEGLVERQKCGLDGRGAYAVLTRAGHERLRDASPWHLASVKRHFLDNFDDADLERLGELLQRPVDRVERRAERGAERRGDGVGGGEPAGDGAVTE